MKSSSSIPTGSRNILSSDVEIKGKLRFANELIIDGRIEGEVNSEGDLTVGENARIVGDIKTRSVIVFGKIEGNITVTDRCELKQNAELHGDVVAGKLAIEEGAAFMGSSAVGTPSKLGSAKPAGSSSSSPGSSSGGDSSSGSSGGHGGDGHK
ncbi:MAG: polymer-forming cytoskeletal protein [Verrucomicrobiales bacterium]|nr:polymer-forming cytoskeletal protein [Verrucomicrobiales bacterium]